MVTPAAVSNLRSHPVEATTFLWLLPTGGHNLWWPHSAEVTSFSWLLPIGAQSHPVEAWTFLWLTYLWPQPLIATSKCKSQPSCGFHILMAISYWSHIHTSVGLNLLLATSRESLKFMWLLNTDGNTIGSAPRWAGSIPGISCNHSCEILYKRNKNFTVEVETQKI